MPPQLTQWLQDLLDPEKREAAAILMLAWGKERPQRLIQFFFSLDTPEHLKALGPILAQLPAAESWVPLLLDQLSSDQNPVRISMGLKLISDLHHAEALLLRWLLAQENPSPYLLQVGSGLLRRYHAQVFNRQYHPQKGDQVYLNFLESLPHQHKQSRPLLLSRAIGFLQQVKVFSEEGYLFYLYAAIMAVLESAPTPTPYYCQQWLRLSALNATQMPDLKTRLAQLKTTWIAAALQILEAGNLKSKKSAAICLGYLKAQESQSQLVPLLDDQYLQKSGLWALSQLSLSNQPELLQRIYTLMHTTPALQALCFDCLRRANAFQNPRVFSEGPPFQDLLQSTSPPLRKLGLWVWFRSQESYPPKQAFAPLIKALKDPVPDVRISAFETLTYLRHLLLHVQDIDAEHMPSLQPVLDAILANQDPPLLAPVLRCIIRTYQARNVLDIPDVPFRLEPEPLLKLMATRRGHIRRLAQRVLNYLPPKHTLPFLLDWLKSELPLQRRLAAETLGKIKASEAIDGLLTALEDPDQELKLLILQALGKLAPVSPIHLPLISGHLLSFLESRTPRFQTVALIAMRRLHCISPALIQALVELLRHAHNPTVLQHTLKTIGKLRIHAALPQLEQLQGIQGLLGTEIDRALRRVKDSA